MDLKQFYREHVLPVKRELGTQWALRASRFQDLDLGIFHHFRPPPSGGTSQFLRALRTELDARGLSVGTNRLSPGTRMCLLSAFTFDPSRLRRFDRDEVRVVHRVDGPVTTYRSADDGTDERVSRLNREFADATVFQSRYSLDKTEELGYDFEDPYVVTNAAAPSIFHPPDNGGLDPNRKVRVIATSWSDNPNKGGPTYKWLEENLDWDRFKFTFVGRCSETLTEARTVGPFGPQRLGEVLRSHDIYIAASRYDPCSNALIEAQACGLPAVYRDSGGHPEIVGEGGYVFREKEEIPGLLDKLAENYDAVRSRIDVPTIEEVADRYLEVLHPDSTDQR